MPQSDDVFMFTLTGRCSTNEESLEYDRTYTITAEEVCERYEKMRNLPHVADRPGDDSIEMIDAIANDMVDDIRRFVTTRVNSLA